MYCDSSPPRTTSQSKAMRMFDTPTARCCMTSVHSRPYSGLCRPSSSKNSPRETPRSLLTRSGEQYASRQPRLPQLHGSPPGTRHMCPNSQLRPLLP